MSLGEKVFSSAALLLIRKIWSNIINLIVMAFLARVLSKEDFGLLAISSVFLSIINTLSTSGIAEYIVYYDGEERNQKLNSAFWLNLFLTICVILVVVLSGPYWADFYENEKIYALLLLMVVPFFFEMGSTVPKAILRKELEYKTLVFYTSISMTLVSLGKLAAAWAGLGVYSLVVPQAFVSPIVMFAFYFKTKWMPYTHIGVTHFKAMFKYSKHIIGSRVLTKLVNEGDNLIVGKFIGIEALGIYALAFQLANLVTTNIVVLVNEIFLPLFSKVKGDLERLRQLYTRMIRFLSFISFPLITVLALAAEPIVYFIYGERWMEAVLPFQILCVFTLGRSISSPSSSLFSAVGRPDISFKFTTYFAPIFLIAVFLGSFYGVVGVAISTTIVRVGGSITLLYLSLNLIQLKLKDLYNTIRCNLLIATSVFLLFSWTFFDFFNELRFFLLLIIPLILYLYFLLQRILFHSEFFLFFLDLERYSPIKHIPIVFRKIFFLKIK